MRRKTKITSATGTIASTMVRNTLWIDFSMKTGVVVGHVDGDTGRQIGFEFGNRGAHAAAELQRVGRGLADDPGGDGHPPVEQDPLRSSAAPSCTRPTSRMRTGNPLGFRMMMSENCAGQVRSVCEVTLNSRCVDSMRPAGNSRLLRRMASSASPW